jgi:hypothetical protein
MRGEWASKTTKLIGIVRLNCPDIPSLGGDAGKQSKTPQSK